jgi:GNAT superfamily N-acetyltransferase
MDETGLTFRFAEKGDAPLILRFIRELAGYEHLEDEVVATEEILDDWLFGKKAAEVIFPVVDGVEIGYALYFYNYSTFLGRAGIYLEDLFVRPAYRGRGYGRAVLRELARIAGERGCGRLEWVCLDWNEPSIGFYRSLGAEPRSEWTVYRLAGERLAALADGE